MLPVMDIDRVRAFVWTVDEGTIVGAARRLHRSQPAVSRLLQQLEDQLGGALLDRSVRPLAATERGLSVLPSARLMLRAHDEMRTAAALTQRQPTVLRVGVSRSLLGGLVQPEFRGARELRFVQLRIQSGWSPRLCAAVARGELDCAVVLMPLDWRAAPSCRAALLRRERLMVIASAGTPSGDMSGRWILNPDGCGFRAALEEALRRRGKTLDVPIEVDAAPWEHLQLVAVGMGMSVVPASSLNPGAPVREVRVPRVQMVTGVWLVAAEGHGLDGVCGLIGRVLSRVGDGTARQARRHAPIVGQPGPAASAGGVRRKVGRLPLRR